MKKIKLFLPLCVSVLIFGSCSKDFLEPEVDQYITDDRIEELLKTDPNAAAKLIDASLRGVYSTLIDNGLNGNTAHDFFGSKSIDLATDLNGEDMVQDVHHHFGFDYNMDNREAAYRRTSVMWALYYKMISSSNIILDTYFKEEPTSDALKASKAKVVGLRGIAYYYLINLYQKTYKGNEEALGVPLVLTPLDENMPRAKVKDVYAQILADLSYSADNGLITNADKTDVDKRVAAAYLAKAYAAMEDWSNVEKYAKISFDGVALRTGAEMVNNGWGDVSTSDWLWGYDINAQTTTLYASLYSHLDGTIPGYAGMLGVSKSIHSALYDKIPVSDERKKLFADSVTFPLIADQFNLTTKNKYNNLKFAKTPSDFSGDYCFIRAQDPLLLYIESLVEQNKLAEATSELEKFVKTRNSSYSASSFASQSALREEVRLQRRIELWGEGTSYYDLKRWNLGIKRNVAGTNHRVKLDFEAGDQIFTYQIPQREVDANKNLGGQNP